MRFKEDWEKSKKRFEALWNREIIDRCCISITAPRDTARYGSEILPDNPEDWMKYRTDGELILKIKIADFENTYFGGESFPQIFLDLGAAGHAGYFKGARYQVEETVWFFPSIEELTEDSLQFDENSMLYRKTIELAEYFTRESRGDFFVSMPDISGNADALAHLMGSENLMMDMIQNKAKVHRALNEIQDVWLRTSEEIFRITHENNDGGSTIGWLSTWASGRHGQMQSDMSVMISPSMFEEFIMPELQAQSRWMDRSTYHFDGIDQLKHLDLLLSLERLDMIQWTNVAGQPSPLKFIDVFRRIQAAGKCLLLSLDPKDIQFVMEQLSSKGLYLLTSASSQEEAESIISMVETLTHD